MNFKKLFSKYKIESLSGRYITNAHIELELEKFNNIFDYRIVGESVNKLPIYSITIGTGKHKILMWSQMHGNESTTTKALFDLLNALNDIELNDILEKCTVIMIPILNPDGAKAYTRLNSNNIDLNRDAQDQSQPESRILRKVFNEFKPDYCFNLHGQRSIFSAGKAHKSAIISFLAPAQDADCTVTATRKIAMSIIVKMNALLQKSIPDQIGIYDDSFNINCVGDTFQSMDVPTILFEAGHFNLDYSRERTREYIVQALVSALHTISYDLTSLDDNIGYNAIPQNRKLFYDIIIQNADINSEKGINSNIAIQYQEQLIDGQITFSPKVEKISQHTEFYAHKYFNANGSMVLTADNKPIFVGYENDLVLINNELFSLKP